MTVGYPISLGVHNIMVTEILTIFGLATLIAMILFCGYQILYGIILELKDFIEWQPRSGPLVLLVIAITTYAIIWRLL